MTTRRGQFANLSQVRGETIEMPKSGATPAEGRLESWKRIANYLGRSVRTVRRWEHSENLPVHRLTHHAGSSVYAFVDELDAWRADRSDAARPPGRKARELLAVLPFSVFAHDEGLAFRGEALTEELINDLASAGSGIGIIARTTMAQYASRALTIAEIGSSLPVDYVIEGSLQRGEGGMRIIAQLIRVDDETHVWSRGFDVVETDWLAVQQRVSRAIATDVLAALERPCQLAAAAPPSVDLDVYRRCHQARGLMHRMHPEAIFRACEIFESIEEKAPDYAPALAGHAQALQLLSIMGCVQPTTVVSRALALALRSIAADPTSADAQCSVGMIQYCFGWDWTAAEKSLRRAISLNPSLVDAMQWLAEVLAVQGRFDEAMDCADRSLELDPLSLSAECSRAFVRCQARRFDEVVESMQGVCEVAPDMPLALILLALGHCYRGAPERAVELLDGHPALEQVPDLVAVYGYALGKAGESGRAEALLESLRRRGEREFISSFHVAMLSLAIGRSDDALDALERACEERFWHMSILGTEAMFDPLREESRFTRLLEKMKLRR